MNDLSLSRILSLWSDLEDAFHGVNGFGGDTAEIYAYRFWEYTPKLDSSGGFTKGSPARIREESARQRKAIHALLELLAMFAKVRCCSIEIDGEPMSDWHRHHWEFMHRAHIRIVHAAINHEAGV